MTRSKNHKSDEDLQGIIKSQKREIKNLHQEIASLKKELGYSQNKTEKSKHIKEETDACLSCGKGILITADFGIRTIISCSLCPFREVIKNG